MSEPFIGEIKMIGFSYAPQGWAFCDGKLLQITQHSDLFSLLGTTFGGNGQTDFALPDLRGCFPIGVGQGEGLSYRTRGERGGMEIVPLNAYQMPAHNHTLNANSSEGSTNNPTNMFLAGVKGVRDGALYADTNNTTMNPEAISQTGGGDPHENMPPFLAIYFIIALMGRYPSKN